MEYGKLNFEMRIEVAHGERVRPKKVNLFSVYCTYDDVNIHLAEFKRLNPELKNVDANWTYVKFFSMENL